MENKISEKAILEYNKLVELCLKIEEKRKKGYLLLDKDNEIIKGKIVFSSPFSSKCITFKNSENSWSTIIYYGKCNHFGKNTFELEVKAAKKYILNSFKLVQIKNPISLKKLYV